MEILELSFVLKSYNDFIEEFIVEDLEEEYDNVKLISSNITEDKGTYILTLIIEYIPYNVGVDEEQMIFHTIYNTINYYCDLIMQ